MNTQDSQALAMQHEVSKARALEANATNDYLNGVISESILLEYMSDTEATIEVAVSAGLSYKDL